jgi:hypothetical protein
MSVKKKKTIKTQNPHFQVGVLGGFFWVLLGGFFIANPAFARKDTTNLPEPDDRYAREELSTVQYMAQ